MTAILPALITSGTSSSVEKGPSRIRSAWNWFRGHIVGPIDLSTRCGAVALLVVGFVLSLLVGNLPLAALFAAAAAGIAVSIVLSLLPAVQGGGEANSASEKKLEKTSEQLNVTANELSGTSKDLSKTNDDLKETSGDLRQTREDLEKQVKEQKRLLDAAEEQLSTFVNGNQQFVQSLTGLSETDDSLKETTNTLEDLVAQAKTQFELFEKALNGEKKKEMLDELALLQEQMKVDRAQLDILKKQLENTGKKLDNSANTIAEHVKQLSTSSGPTRSNPSSQGSTSLPKKAPASNLSGGTIGRS